MKTVQEEHNFPPHHVFNVDETGLTTVQSKSSKVLALKGRRQVGTLTSAERGVLSTVVVCMSAGGNFVPPMVIFPRVRMKAELQDGAPAGTIFACHSSGWMHQEIFIQWLRHFLDHTKPCENDPVLLMLDGHLTHTRNLEFIDLARKNHTTVVCMPPHCKPQASVPGRLFHRTSQHVLQPSCRKIPEESSRSCSDTVPNK